MPVGPRHIYLRLECRPYYLYCHYRVRFERFGPAHPDFERDRFAGDENIGRNYLQVKFALLRAALQVIGYYLVEIQPDLAAAPLSAGRLGGRSRLVGREWLRAASACGRLAGIRLSRRSRNLNRRRSSRGL